MFYFNSYRFKFVFQNYNTCLNKAHNSPIAHARTCALLRRRDTRSNRHSPPHTQAETRNACAPRGATCSQSATAPPIPLSPAPSRPTNSAPLPLRPTGQPSVANGEKLQASLQAVAGQGHRAVRQAFCSARCAGGERRSLEARLGAGFGRVFSGRGGLFLGDFFCGVGVFSCVG